MVCYLQQSIRPLKEPIRDEKYSKHPIYTVGTYDFRFQADQVLVYRVLSEKSAWKCS